MEEEDSSPTTAAPATAPIVTEAPTAMIWLVPTTATSATTAATGTSVTATQATMRLTAVEHST